MHIGTLQAMKGWL